MVSPISSKRGDTSDVNIAKKHRSSMLSDQVIENMNSQDLVVNTDNALLDRAAFEESQMWMENWDATDFTQEDVVNAQQAPPLQPQELSLMDCANENEENIPNRQSLTDLTPFTSTPTFLSGAMQAGRPNMDESIIELQPLQPRNVRRIFSENSVQEVRPSLPIKRKLFNGVYDLVSTPDDINITSLLTQNQPKEGSQQQQQQSALKSSVIAKHLEISEKYFASDECFALTNSYPANKIKGISYVKPHIGKKGFDVVLSVNTLCSKPDALYINTYKNKNDTRKGDNVYFTADQFGEVRSKFTHFFKETAGGRAVNTLNWVFGELKYSLMKQEHGDIIITSQYKNDIEGTTFSARILESEIPLFKRRMNTTWGIVDILNTKRKMRNHIIEKLSNKYKNSSSETCKLKRFNYIFDTYYVSLPITSSVIPPIFMCLEGIISKENDCTFL